MKAKLVLLIILSTHLSSCKTDKWEAIVYDDKSNLIEYKILGVYGSLATCRNKAVSYLNNAGLQSAGDYECGLNCEFREGLANTRICEITEH